MSRTFSRRRLLAGGLTTPWLASHALAAAAAPPITCISFSPQGDRILAGSQRGVSLRDADSGQPLDLISSEMDNIHDIRFSHDGRQLLVAGGIPGEAGVVEFFRWPDGVRVQHLELHDDAIYSVDWAPDDSSWAAASGDEVCTVHTLNSDASPVRLTKHSRAVMAVRFLADSKTVVTASRDQTLRVWDAGTGQSIRTLHNHSSDVLALALAPGDAPLPMIASAAADRTVRLWQPTIGRMVRFARLDSRPLCLAWIDAGRRLLAGCEDGKARLIDPVTVEVSDTMTVSSGWLMSVAADPRNDRRVAFGTLDDQSPVVTL